jgi:transcriptional regulator GlxA family with amidase domain
MTQVNVEGIVDHLSAEIRKALAQAVREVAPEVVVEPRTLFRAFRRAVGRKCRAWEPVPDKLIKN